MEEEFIINKLQKQIEEILAEKSLLQYAEENPSHENHKLRLQLENLKLENESILQQLRTQNKILKEEVQNWQSKFDKVSTEKLELERTLENEEEHRFNDVSYEAPRPRSVSLKAPRSLTFKPVSVPYLLSPRGKSSPYRTKFLKKGWFEVKENDQAKSNQFIVLTEEAILGFEHENVERIPDDAIQITIPLDKVSNVVVKDGVLSIQDKGGNYYQFHGPDSEVWMKLIISLLPC